MGEDIKTVEFGWPLGMPLVRPLANGLFEVRSTLPGDRIARVIFCLDAGTMVLLHGFMKKTPKTPKTEIELPAKRKKEYEQ